MENKVIYAELCDFGKIQKHVNNKVANKKHKKHAHKIQIISNET